MKTAAEWTDESIEKGGDDADGFVAFVEAVQRDAIEAAAAFVDEVNRRATGRALEPISLEWIAEKIRALAPGGNNNG